ncbi:hypothetical protein KCU71_g9636, partial [Aureobasidium melanogenum]
MVPIPYSLEKVGTILLSYNKTKDDIHPIVVRYYAKDLGRTVNFAVKVPSTTEELKQELRTSIKSGRKYAYESDRLSVTVPDVTSKARQSDVQDSTRRDQ